MKKIKFIGFTLASVLAIVGCEQEVIDLKDPEVVVVEDCPDDATAGSANFTKYVAIGNSLTAGFQAGALFDEGQANSLGAILAKQFECVGGGVFNQPDINSELGFFLGGGNPTPNGTILGRLLLQGTPPTPTPTVSNAAAAPSPFNPAFVFTGQKSELNNFGVPGIQLGQILITETGDWTKADIDPDTPGAQPDPRFNPLYARFASTPGSSTILGDAVAALANGGTFFSFWLGNNDVLGYALTGGANPSILTSPEDFEQRLNIALGAILTVPNVKGVVGNIPNITAIPYFNLVPYNAVPMTSQTVVDQLNAGYAQYNAGLNQAVGLGALSAEERDRRKVEFALGANPVVIIDESLTDLSGFGIPSYREATANDKLVLTASSFIGTSVGGDPTKVNGVSVPLSDQWVLIPAEQTEIETRVGQFNQIIADVVAANNDRLALANVNARVLQLLTARLEMIDGVAVSPTLPPPTGLYSEDGIHANSRGIALIANVFIDAINTKFGASVPKVKLGRFKATALPI